MAPKQIFSSLASSDSASSAMNASCGSTAAKRPAASGAGSKMGGHLSWVLIAGLLATFAVSGQCASLELNEQSIPKPSADVLDQSPHEEPMLSSSSSSLGGLVKRSAPASGSAYGHSIMRFGRAPHNIMHFGKRASTGGDQYLDTYLEQQQQPLSDPYYDTAELDTGALATVPDWLLANLIAAKNGGTSGGSGSAYNRQTKYLVFPVSVPIGAAGAGGSYGFLNGGTKPSPAKKARMSEESDNVFMHFG